jgi:hypothetical protein
MPVDGWRLEDTKILLTSVNGNHRYTSIGRLHNEELLCAGIARIFLDLTGLFFQWSQDSVRDKHDAFAS